MIFYDLLLFYFIFCDFKWFSWFSFILNVLLWFSLIFYSFYFFFHGFWSPGVSPWGVRGKTFNFWFSFNSQTQEDRGGLWDTYIGGPNRCAWRRMKWTKWFHSRLSSSPMIGSGKPPIFREGNRVGRCTGALCAMEKRERGVFWPLFVVASFNLIKGKILGSWCSLSMSIDIL